MSGRHTKSLRLESRALAALLCFVAIGFAVNAFCTASSFDRFQANQHQWTWWPIQGFRQRAKVPQVVFIGSSLLQKIIQEGEVQYLQKPVPLFTHNRCVHFEDEYKRLTGHQIDTYAFGIGGLHSSDADVLFDGVIAQKPPQTLIYLVAPRDVMDNNLETPLATDTFKLVSRISDQSAMQARCRVHLSDKFLGGIADVLQNTNPLLQYRTELQVLAIRQWIDLYSPAIRAFAPPATTCTDETAAGCKQDPFDLPADAYMNPDSSALTRVTNNFEQYACTYQPFRPKSFNLQFDFLKDMLSAAYKQKTDVIIVNMPLRSDNLEAMPKGFYNLYRKTLMATAQQNGAKYVDMFDSNRFPYSDFADTVHLSGKGCCKFITALTEQISPAVLTSTSRKPQVAAKSSAVPR